MSKKTISSNSRRKFFKVATSAVVAGGLLAACKPEDNTKKSGAAEKSVKLTMQAAWPSGANIFFEMAQDYCNMVRDMSGGSLTIDLKPVGAVVKTSEIGQAVSSGIVDMGHWVTAYWYGKNAAASLFGTGPSYGMSSQEVWHGWSTRRKKVYEEALLSWIIIQGSFICYAAQPFGGQKT